MPPLNLDLLIAGDDAEWDRAWNDHGFNSLARKIVEAVLWKYRPKGEGNPFVDELVAEALFKLMRRVKSGTITSVNGLKPLLIRIASHEAIGLLRKQWFNKEQHAPASESEDQDDWGIDDPEHFLRSLRRQAGIGVNRPMEEVIEEWADSADLDSIEKALFREHLAYRCTLEEFGETYELHPSSVFRLKTEVITKLKRLFRGER